MKKYLRFSFVVALFIVLSFSKCFAQWYFIPQLKYTNIYCSLSLGDSTFIVGGDNGTLLKSTDNGNTWSNIMQNGIQADTVLSLGKGLGYIFAGANGVEDVYRSSDNGNSWSAANGRLPIPLIINQFAFIDNLLFVATSGGIYSSADSGKTWQADTAGLNLGLIIPELNNSTVGLVAAGNNLFTIKSVGGNVYTTSKDSIFWKQISTNFYRMGFAIAAVDTNIFIANQDGIFLYEGNSIWTAKNNGLPINDSTFISSCSFSASDSLLFVYIVSGSHYSFSKDIFATSDLGNTWTKVNDSVSVRNSINTISSNREFLFAGTQMGGWRIPISSVITSIAENIVQNPSNYFLLQNYPNPFNPATTIVYQIPHSGDVLLNIYDVLGRKIKTLVSKFESKGKYEINFNADNLASGIYFYQLRTSNFILTKKMLLLK